MMYSLNICALFLVMMVMTTMMFDGSSAGDVFMKASNPTPATWYHPQALRFQNIIEDEFDSYYENFGEFFFGVM